MFCHRIIYIYKLHHDLLKYGVMRELNFSFGNTFTIISASLAVIDNGQNSREFYLHDYDSTIHERLFCNTISKSLFRDL